MNVSAIKAAVPSFEGWLNMLPGTGIPLLGHLYVDRLNNLSHAWADCAGILQDVLDKDGVKLVHTAENYRRAHIEAEAAVDKIDH
ncbi:hypothetical protein OHA77_15200 [Streptosporangium sp. NBC_01639]|uniref:hypothetical protein n=1 Tax=Streptosporangium sp. NBC_01639 TaxID=2975948 RepID=UPI00386B88F7|nr:hypothetical protein OHA77_15200 [Streptosporangium sp. NBC_01639]